MLNRLAILIVCFLLLRAALALKLDACPDPLHPKIEERIRKDTSAWGEKGITEDLVLSVSKFCENEARITEQHCNCHPQRILIEDGVVYVNNVIPSHRLGPHEHIGLLVELYEASQVYKLPNVEFTYWLDDHAPAETIVQPDGSVSWPYPPHGLPPMVAWSKWEENGVMVVPYSGAFRCAHDSFDALERQLEQIHAVPWEERKEIAFGRWNGFCTFYYNHMRTADGEVTPCPRTYLSNLSASHPDLLDAYDLGVAKPVPLAHQNRFKYIVSTDGWSISSKFDKYLLLGSTVLKAASPRIGFYYDALEPGVHYLPWLVRHKDDILEQVAWLRSHDAEARRMAAEAHRFARTHLTRPARLCYLFRLLTQLSKQYRYPVSCRRRKLCVPLAHELRYFARYERTRKTCGYDEVLSRYEATDPWAAPGNFSFDAVSALHEDPLHWPRDDLP